MPFCCMVWEFQLHYMGLDTNVSWGRNPIFCKHRVRSSTHYPPVPSIPSYKPVEIFGWKIKLRSDSRLQSNLTGPTSPGKGISALLRKFSKKSNTNKDRTNHRMINLFCEERSLHRIHICQRNQITMNIRW